MKVKIIAHWKHGFVMEDDLELSDGNNATLNAEKLCSYYNSINNIVLSINSIVIINNK